MNNLLMNGAEPDQRRNDGPGRCDTLRCSELYGCSLNVTNDFILIFDKRLRLISISRACAKTLKDGISLEHLYGEDFFFFAPDLEEVGSHGYFENASPGDLYASDDYGLKAPCNKENSFYSEMKVTKFNNETVIVAKDITKQRQILFDAKSQESRLNQLVQECGNLKIAVDVIMNSVNEKQGEIKRNYCRNIEELVFPMLDIIKAASSKSQQKAALDILENNLQTITDSFSQVLGADKYELTQREIQIANLIRLGKTTKQISDILNLSCKTVDYHRMNIRKRLDICNTKDDLRAHLLEVTKSM
jgi:DNA-binding CsgD family transcriptional regulator